MSTYEDEARRPCIGHHEPYDIVLHPRPGTPISVREHARERAAALCARCPAPCDEPVSYRPPPSTAGLPPIRHGTPQGAQQHWHRREDPCDACRDAYNSAQRERRAERAAARALGAAGGEAA